MKSLGALGAALLPAALALGVLQLYIDGRLSGIATVASVVALVFVAVIATSGPNRR
jgi:hypothetical protein